MEHPTASSPDVNQIFYGPPGTGKTYTTLNEALRILDAEFLAAHEQDREAIKRRFDDLVAEGKIRFVTFHQSFSYEDFVEGLRAESDEETQQLRYEVVDGVFKSLCETAATKVVLQAPAPVTLAGRKIWKMSLGNTLGSDAGIYDECLAGGYALLGYGGNIDFTGCQTRAEIEQRFADRGVAVSNAYDYAVTSVMTFINRMKIGDLVVVSDGNFKVRAIGEISGDYRYQPHSEYLDGYAQRRPVKWLRQYQPSLPYTELANNQFSQMTLYELRAPTLNPDKLLSLLGQGSAQATFTVGQVFSSNYRVVQATPEMVELCKPNGNLITFSLRMLNTLCEHIRQGEITVQDIRDKKIFERVTDSQLEPYVVHGYNNVIAHLVEFLLGGQPGNLPLLPEAPVNDARVLIIDEINRGNISRIFGELITLIEPSKRAGEAEALSVVLPYSKTPFSVPNNVYLIGTMNTADRSLAGLDMALRRRFTFKEMPPRPELLDGVTVEGVDVGALLRVMNQRIEVLLDRDHCLGHAYFMPLRAQPALPLLAQLFQQQIVPLLQEYFFEDWQRIQWVLNDHRKPEALRFIRQPANDLSQLFGEEVPLNGQGRWELNDAAFGQVEAYAGILGPAGGAV